MAGSIKEFFKLFGPLVLGICLLSAWFLHSRNQNHLELVQGRQETTVALGARIITRTLSNHASDAQFLARLVARHVDDDINDRMRHIEDTFIDFARSRRFYFILRFIDEAGEEQVRVDRSFAGPVISPPGTLQNKSTRYYVQQALQAGKNDVYISKFDLNMEHGRVEVPLRPTLRFACPVVDNLGRKRGLIVLNFDGASLLEQIRQQAKTGDGVTMLCNGDGYWLLGISPEDEWGHILEDAADANMAKRFPGVWEIISRVDDAQFTNKYGLFSFDTVGIIPDSVMSDVPPSVEEARKRWKIITWVPEDRLSVPWMPMYAALTTLFLALLAAGCWSMANYRIRQKDAEARLRENEERTLAISQSVQDAIVMIDGQDRINHWNPAAERMFGYTRAEVMGKKLHPILAPQDVRDQAMKSLASFAANGQGRTVDTVQEFEAVRKDGSTVPVELAISSFKFKGQWYAVGSMRDTTRRREDELKLRQSEETSRALLNAPTESAILIEPNGLVVAVNEIGALRMGRSPEELIGLSIYELSSADKAELRRNAVMKVASSGTPLRFEDTRDGRTYLSNIYPVLDPDGNVERIAIFARDVTEQRLAEAALIHSEQRFRDVSAAVGEFIWETDNIGRITYITEDVEQVIGYAVEEIIGTQPADFLHDDEKEDYAAWRESLYLNKEPFTNIETRNVTKDGRTVWLQMSGVPFYDENGDFGGYRGAAMNISDRKATDEAIKASERKLRALAESAYDAIVMIDTNGYVSFWNHAAERLFGYTEGEALGRSVHDLVAREEERERAEKGMFRFAMTGEGPVVGTVQEVTARRKDGSLVPVERSISGFRLGQSWYAVATIRDITERKATEAKLRELATTDSLTGLNNRRRFMELAEREFSRSVRYGRSLSLFMLDIDHFKNVNDTYGHDIGDEVLRTLSEVSVMALRGADILGRLGGEEFGVLLPETGEDAALEVAERLRSSIERTTISTDAGALSITVSIGMAVLTEEIENVQSLIKRADVALYDAKQSGRNRVVKGA